MYSIGIISTSVETDKPYINILKNLNFKVEFIDIENSEAYFEHLDVLLVDEVKNPSSGDCYEIILKVRSQFEGFLLVLTHNKLKTTDLVYLQLGVDGIARDDVAYEVTFIQLKRFFDLMKASSTIKPLKQAIKGSADSLRLNSQNISVIKNNSDEIELTNKEYQMLAFLMEHAGVALSYKELYQKIWHQENGLDKDYQYLVTNIVFKLRIKLGKDSNGDNYIRTIRTKGYMFNPSISTM